MEIQADDKASSADEGDARPAVEIVVPVFNEERDLAVSIHRLHAYVSSSFPFSARVTIADNGSTDGTWAIATGLAGLLRGVRALRVPEAGRGGALHTVWSASDADVVAYMDVDLSTHLSALLGPAAFSVQTVAAVHQGALLAAGPATAQVRVPAAFEREAEAFLEQGNFGLGGARRPPSAGGPEAPLKAPDQRGRCSAEAGTAL